MSNGSTVSVEIRQEITYPGMPTGGVHRLNTSVTVRHGGNAADATVHTNTTNFAASDNRSAPESSGDSQPTNSASTTMPQSSDDLFGDFNLSNDDFKELFTGFPPDFQFSAEDLEQLDCHMMASTSSSLRLDSNDFSLSSRNSQHFLMDSNGSQMKTSSSQSNQFSSNQSGQVQYRCFFYNKHVVG